MDHYKQRAHRQKYKLGYGCEGVDRDPASNELPPSDKMSPKEQSYAAADDINNTGVMEKGEHVKGQKSRTRATYIKTQISKTRPNPY